MNNIFTIFINNAEIGTFHSTLNGAKMAARSVQQNMPKHKVSLRYATGEINVRSTGTARRLELLNNAHAAVNPSTLVMATDDAGSLVPVVAGPGGLLVVADPDDSFLPPEPSTPFHVEWVDPNGCSMSKEFETYDEQQNFLAAIDASGVFRDAREFNPFEEQYEDVHGEG